MRRRKRLVKSRAIPGGHVVQRQRQANAQSGKRRAPEQSNGDGSASRAGRQTDLLQLQKSHGNAFVRRLLTNENAAATKPSQPSASGVSNVSMAEIQTLAAEATGKTGAIVSLAGTPEMKDKPSGLTEIFNKASGGSISVAGGLTIAYDDFKKPKVDVNVERKQKGDKELFFASLQQTSAKDTKHDSYYPGPGLHKREGYTRSEGGKTYQYYFDIKPKTSEMIKTGEQEHLNDHERAYKLVYGRVVKVINALAGKKIGPASSEEKARKKAKARLARKLPAPLRTSPEKWHEKLIALLKASKKRDDKKWHALNPEPTKTIGDKIIIPVGKERTTKIGKVPSKKVIKL